jgi:hypothetical protein
MRKHPVYMGGALCCQNMVWMDPRGKKRTVVMEKGVQMMKKIRTLHKYIKNHFSINIGESM